MWDPQKSKVESVFTQTLPISVLMFLHFHNDQEPLIMSGTALQTHTWTVLLALICSLWRRSHCCLCWYCKSKGTNYPLWVCRLGMNRADMRMEVLFTLSMLLWCFCSLSRSVGRATLMNLWIGASRRLSVSLLPSSAMCPADCPQPTPLQKLDAAPTQFYLTAHTVTGNTRQVGLSYIHESNELTVIHRYLPTHLNLAPQWRYVEPNMDWTKVWWSRTCRTFYIHLQRPRATRLRSQGAYSTEQLPLPTVY